MAKDDKKTEKSAKLRVRKTTSMRDKAVNAQKKKDAPHRVRSGIKAVQKPLTKAKQVSKLEYHLFQPKESGVAGFLTKNRYWTPRYFRDAYAELKNVTWPSRRDTWKMVFAVFAFSAIVGIAISLVDFGLEKLFKEVLL